jgi:hypothetical protein
MNIIWLQAAPTAFANIGWKFYLCFIIPGLVAAPIIWTWFPNTLGVPLEEVAAIFGDQDELWNAAQAAENAMSIRHQGEESAQIPSRGEGDGFQMQWPQVQALPGGLSGRC